MNHAFKKRFVTFTTASALLLLIPLIGMQLSEEVNWTGFDFLVAAALLLGTGLFIELALRVFHNSRHKAIACLLVLALALLVWAELAVGIFGSPWAGS